MDLPRAKAIFGYGNDIPPEDQVREDFYKKLNALSQARLAATEQARKDEIQAKSQELVQARDCLLNQSRRTSVPSSPPYSGPSVGSSSAPRPAPAPSPGGTGPGFPPRGSAVPGRSPSPSASGAGMPGGSPHVGGSWPWPSLWPPRKSPPKRVWPRRWIAALAGVATLALLTVLVAVAGLGPEGSTGRTGGPVNGMHGASKEVGPSIEPIAPEIDADDFGKVAQATQKPVRSLTPDPTSTPIAPGALFVRPYPWATVLLEGSSATSLKWFAPHREPKTLMPGVYKIRLLFRGGPKSEHLVRVVSGRTVTLIVNRDEGIERMELE